MSKYEVRKHEVITRLMKRDINAGEAAKQLELSVRQIQNIKKRFQEKGARGLIHASRGKPSNRKFTDQFIEKVKHIVKKNYPDFGPTFAAEKLEENHQIKLGKETLRIYMSEWGLWQIKPKKKPKQYRAWRQRREQYGELEQFDGSYFDWFEEGKNTCLLASIDDATGRPTRLEFADNEGVVSVFNFWQSYILEHGKPLEIYLDRFSTYKSNHKNAIDNEALKTQFQRVAKELGIRLITAYSPQAKGRVERLFETLQDRLVKELRLARIKDREKANKFMKDIYIPQYAARFGVKSAKEGNLHRPLSDKEKSALPSIFSKQETRVVANDFTLSYKNQHIQLEESQPTLVLPKETILIEERLDDSLHLKLRNNYLNFRVLPERPPKMTPRIALTRKSTAHKPASDHPWKKSYKLTRSNYQSIN